MSSPPAASPEETVYRLFRAFDALDTETIEAMFGSDGTDDYRHLTGIGWLAEVERLTLERQDARGLPRAAQRAVVARRPWRHC